MNQDLSSEADRLGLSGYTLPDPADTATKIAAFLSEATTKELNGDPIIGMPLN